MEKGWKLSDFVNAGNGYLYGIPYNARRVIQFNEETQVATRTTASVDTIKLTIIEVSGDLLFVFSSIRLQQQRKREY